MPDDVSEKVWGTFEPDVLANAAGHESANAAQETTRAKESFFATHFMATQQ